MDNTSPITENQIGDLIDNNSDRLFRVTWKDWRFSSLINIFIPHPSYEVRNHGVVGLLAGWFVGWSVAKVCGANSYHSFWGIIMKFGTNEQKQEITCKCSWFTVCWIMYLWTCVCLSIFRVIFDSSRFCSIFYLTAEIWTRVSYWILCFHI